MEMEQRVYKVNKYNPGLPIETFATKKMWMSFGKGDAEKLADAIRDNNQKEFFDLMECIIQKDGLEVAKNAKARCHGYANGEAKFRYEEVWSSFLLFFSSTENIINTALENNWLKPYQVMFSPYESKHESSPGNSQKFEESRSGESYGKSIRSLCFGGHLKELCWVDKAKKNPDDWKLTIYEDDGDENGNWIKNVFYDCLHPGNPEEQKCGRGQNIEDMACKTYSSSHYWPIETYEAFMDLGWATPENVLDLQKMIKEFLDFGVFEYHYTDWYNEDVVRLAESRILKRDLQSNKSTTTLKSL